MSSDMKGFWWMSSQLGESSSRLWSQSLGFFKTFSCDFQLVVNNSDRLNPVVKQSSKENNIHFCTCVDDCRMKHGELESQVE